MNKNGTRIENGKKAMVFAIVVIDKQWQRMKNRADNNMSGSSSFAVVVVGGNNDDCDG